MAKTKIVIAPEDVQEFTKAADAFGVKVLDNVPMGSDALLQVSFRNPAELYRVGVIVGSLKRQLELPLKKKR